MNSSLVGKVDRKSRVNDHLKRLLGITPVAFERHPYQDSQFPETCLLLAQRGINPDTVALEGFGPAGYQTFILDKAGRRQWNKEGEFLMDVNEWPVSEYWRDEIIDTYIAEGGKIV